MNKRLTGVLLALALICMAAPAMAQPTPFVISGYTTDLDLQPIDNSNVTVTNLGTVKWAAVTTATSNYYRLVLSSDDVSDGVRLRIIAVNESTDYHHIINVTTHEVTATEMDDGGISDLNLTLNHYCLNYYPDYKWFTQEDFDYSGAAVLQMWADFKGLDYAQDELQAYGLDNNTQADKDAGLQYIDPLGMAETLNKLPLSAHFTVGRMDNTTEGLSYAMHRICWWQYLGPGALPTGGYYDKWMSVRGIHTDKNPHDGQYGGYGDWGYTVYGFWINDPHNESLQGSGGIGANSYKTADEWTTNYYTEIVDPYNNESGPSYNNFNHKYITVLEPPEHDADVRIAPAKPRFVDPITPVMTEKILVVYDVEQLALEKLVKDDESLKIVAAAIDGANEQLVPYDPAFAEVFAETAPGEPMLVAGGDGDYCLVPFNVPAKVKPIKKVPVTIEMVKMSGLEKLERVKRVDANAIIKPIPIEPAKVERTLVVVLVDAEDGSFKEASWVTDPVKYLPVSEVVALKLALGEIAVTDSNELKALGSKPTIELVYRDASPYYPDWKITVNGKVFYIGQDGTVSSGV